MHAILMLLVFWCGAFTTLGIALVVLAVFLSAVEYDLELRSLGAEAAIAAIASLVEATGFWVIVSYSPTALRAMFVPALIVALIYKAAHLEDWGKIQVMLLLVFQGVITAFCWMLLLGHFGAALIIFLVFGFVLFIYGSFVKSL